MSHDSSARIWGPLRIIEHVGRGTFGDVYRAWDSRLDREVALKILRRQERDDQAHASTVIQEGRLLARVRHPNVVTVYGAERVNGQVGVWMEFVHGKTLEQELRDQGPFEVDRVIRIGIELQQRCPPSIGPDSSIATSRPRTCCATAMGVWC